jgi:hypothetical protein
MALSRCEPSTESVRQVSNVLRTKCSFPRSDQCRQTRSAGGKPENKVSLGFVEGLSTKIRVIQRRAYGLRNDEYLRLKILTCMLLQL